MNTQKSPAMALVVLAFITGIAGVAYGIVEGRRRAESEQAKARLFYVSLRELAQTKAYVDNLFHAADEATAEQGSRMELLETLNGIIVDNARELSKQGSVPDEVHRLLTRPLGDIPKDQRFPPAASRRIVLPEGP